MNVITEFIFYILAILFAFALIVFGGDIGGIIGVIIFIYLLIKNGRSLNA